MRKLSIMALCGVVLAISACDKTPPASGPVVILPDDDTGLPRDRCGEVIQPGTTGTPRNQPCR